MQGLAIVTGATSDTGLATCRELYQQGWHILICYHSDKRKALCLKKEFKSNSARISLKQLDLTSTASISELKRFVIGLKIPVKALINIASFSRPASGYQNSIASLSLPDIYQSLETDFFGLLRLLKVFEASLRRAHGSIICFGSASALGNDSDLLQYLPARLSVSAFTRGLARTLAPKVRINCIAPGALNTGWLDKWSLPTNEREKLGELCPLKRLGGPDEIAKIVSFLASEDSSYITGQTIIADGGLFCP